MHLKMLGQITHRLTSSKSIHEQITKQIKPTSHKMTNPLILQIRRSQPPQWKMDGLRRGEGRGSGPNVGPYILIGVWLICGWFIIDLWLFMTIYDWSMAYCYCYWFMIDPLPAGSGIRTATLWSSAACQTTGLSPSSLPLFGPKK